MNLQKIVRLDGKCRLTPTEELGDPQAVALELLNTSSVKEEIPIVAPRASGLQEACIRKYVLGTKFNLIETRWTNFSSSVTFGLGSAFHYWAQNTGMLFGDTRRGFWECSSCGEFDASKFGPEPKESCSCGVSKYLYREFGVHIKKPVEFTMHCDMFIETNGVYRIVEIKTINGDAFDRLIAPLAPHEYQVTTYVIGASVFKNRLFPKFDPQVAYVLYVSKQHKYKELPVKMFPVKITTSKVMEIMGKLNAYAEGVRYYPNRLPECNSKCRPPDFNTQVANTCPALSICKGLYDADTVK